MVRILHFVAKCGQTGCASRSGGHTGAVHVSISAAPPVAPTYRTSPEGCLGTFVGLFLQVGLATLATGVLIFFAARTQGGGLYGIVLFSLLSWPFFEGGWAILGGIAKVRARVEPRHRVAGGCLGAVLFCSGLLFVQCLGWQALLGIAVGGVLTAVNQRGSFVNWPRLLGLATTSPPADSTEPAIPPRLHPWAKAGAGLLAALVGFVFAGFGTFRFLETNSVYTDSGCTHPCALVHGLWVQVMPDPEGSVVTRVDPSTVRLSLRFWDDAPGDKTIRPSDFALKTSETTYEQLVGSPGCDAWTPRTIGIDGVVSGLALCFTVPQAVDLSQLVLDWTPPGGAAEIWLGQVHQSGGFEIGVNATPSSPSP